MHGRFAKLVLVCSVLSGCGGDVGPNPPRLTGDFDWVVRINFSDQHSCTGIVLSDHWLLTAGHCLEDAPDEQVELSQQVFGKRTVLYDGAAELILHPDYDPLGFLTHRWNDIGLLGLRDGALEVSERPRLAGLDCSCIDSDQGDYTLYEVGYGREPDPNTGLCSDTLGSKKRYDGFAFRMVNGPLPTEPREVELDGRQEALCDGDSGAPLMFDRDGLPHVFAVFSGESFMRTIFYGTLIGPKLGWFESATESTAAPLDCVDFGGDSWECSE